MDRYYRILGIPENSTKEVIKKAYHEKMKALHPDKVHGTTLEDTATFFSTEINEAYNQLMEKHKENNNSSTKNQPSFIEKEIYIETIGYLKYTLSNNIDTIINEIYNRLRYTFPDRASQISWIINPSLSKNVKEAMETHNMNYSMTSFYEGSIEYVLINKRKNNEWYICNYESILPQKTSSPGTKKYNYPNKKKSKLKGKSLFSLSVKIIIAIIIFGIFYNHFNGQPLSYNQSEINYSRTTQIFATVTSCDWLNVRNSPSSANNNNIIEAISRNSKVEILERNNNNWVKIKYNNGRTGYVYGNYLK
ncbi:MAG: DnaJ domain-containing protein [Treponema sp.]|nr:DnaJ domain-containing protein [Treponema sp.]MCL2273140.1 DnaJ domain-containing protein [Treponema sp.]